MDIGARVRCTRDSANVKQGTTGTIAELRDVQRGRVKLAAINTDRGAAAGEVHTLPLSAL